VRRPRADHYCRIRAYARMCSVETEATAHEGPGADALQPPLRCVATRERDGPHTIKARKDKKESAGQPAPAASRCPYPDVLRSHPRDEALGPMVHKREASSGQGPGEDAKDEHTCRTGRRPGKRTLPKRLTGSAKRHVGRAEISEHRGRCSLFPPGSRSQPPASVAFRLSTG
jgi:hypothetical protein